MGMPQAASLTFPRRIIVTETDADDWRWPKELGRKLGLPSNWFAARPPYKPE